MSRRRVLAKINGWTLVAAGDIDGLVQLDGPTREARLTVRTWKMIVGHPTRPGQLLNGLHAYATDPNCDQIVVDDQAVKASRRLDGHRTRFQARRRQLRPAQLDVTPAMAPVVALRRHQPV